MSSEFFAEAWKVTLGAVVGGALTAATAFPRLNNRLTKLATEVNSMKESCTACKGGMDTSLTSLAEKVRVHHEDDDKHTSSASRMMLKDILDRVMRIESKMFNGNSRVNGD